MSIFTRHALREIVPELTREQEQKIIDLYVKSTESFVKTIKQMEAEKAAYQEGKDCVSI